MDNIHEIKKDQWNKNYKQRNQYITNTSVQEMLNYHNLPCPSNKIVLDIGVGRGDFIKALSENNTIIGVDVSEEALNVVKPYCKNIYFSKDLDKIEPVDLAFCNLVIQHNHEYEVARIINDINLKFNAVFSIQFATLNIQKSIMTPKIMADINSSMLYFYSIEKMKEIIERTDKQIKNTFGPLWFGHPYNFEWHIFHLINKK